MDRELTMTRKTLEQEQAGRAFSMDTSSVFQAEPASAQSDPGPLQGLGGRAEAFAGPQTLSRTHSDPYSRN